MGLKKTRTINVLPPHGDFVPMKHGYQGPCHKYHVKLKYRTHSIVAKGMQLSYFALNLLV